MVSSVKTKTRKRNAANNPFFSVLIKIYLSLLLWALIDGSKLK